MPSPAHPATHTQPGTSHCPLSCKLSNTQPFVTIFADVLYRLMCSFSLPGGVLRVNTFIKYSKFRCKLY